MYRQVCKYFGPDCENDDGTKRKKAKKENKTDLNITFWQ